MTDERNNTQAIRAFGKLVDIVAKLRAPGGCPWDREQTPKTLRTYVIEEAYEVVDAIDSEDAAAICEELGDLLLQVVLQAQIAEENSSFTVADVADAISEKLIHRHPHVFGDVEVNTASQVISNWERIKEREKKGRGLFDSLPQALPALQRSARIGEKAARVGFDWSTAKNVREKVMEELAELDEAIAEGDAAAVEWEMGDLLFAIAQWARHLKCQPEQALANGCQRFLTRFARMEQIAMDANTRLGDWTIEQMEQVWQKVKAND